MSSSAAFALRENRDFTIAKAVTENKGVLSHEEHSDAYTSIMHGIVGVGLHV